MTGAVAKRLRRTSTTTRAIVGVLAIVGVGALLIPAGASGTVANETHHHDLSVSVVPKSITVTGCTPHKKFGVTTAPVTVTVHDSDHDRPGEVERFRGSITGMGSFTITSPIHQYVYPAGSPAPCHRRHGEAEVKEEERHHHEEASERVNFVACASGC
jgi:hypothetical protein